MKLEIGQLVIHDGFLVEVINISKDQLFLRPFSGLRAIHPLDRTPNNLKDINTDILGKECYADYNNIKQTVVSINNNTVILKYVDGDNTEIFNEKYTSVKYKNLDQTIKESNPKDSIGISKVPMSTLSGPVLMEMALGMAEGGIKYGTHNYREIGVRYRVYFDATMRHLWAAFEGEDIDPASGLPHIIKAMTSLHVLRDAQIRDKCFDDRPKGTKDFIGELNKKMKNLLDNSKEIKEPYLANGREPDKYNG